MGRVNAAGRRLALVTGASAGIGAAFARAYGRRGHDLVLTARRGERLAALAQELRAAHGVETLILPLDLAEPEAPGRLIAELEAHGRTVDVLVNNAGYGLPGTFAATRWEDQQAALQVMLTAVCETTHRLLPGMLARRYGRIVNVASLAGLVPPAAGHTLYGATKSFLVRFSQSLHLETKGTGVHVSALCPGFTYSEFHDVNGTRERAHRATPRWMWQDAEAVAEIGCHGVERNRPLVVAGAPNKAIAALGKLLPDDLVLRLMAAQGPRIRGL